LIDAVIDTKGKVVEMRAISGRPLLIPVALAAVNNGEMSRCTGTANR